MIEGLAGYQGFIELLASNGESLSITLFDSMENAEAAEPTFDEEMPKKLGELSCAASKRRPTPGTVFGHRWLRSRRRRWLRSRC
jgi:hypothetical protein